MDLQKARELAVGLMVEHGIEPTWNFQFDHSIRRFGCCNFRTKTIQLSMKLTELNDYDNVRDTILHEIAHALVGVGQGHGWKWKLTAIKIGCNGKRTYDSATVNLPPKKYRGTCEKCGYTFTRNRQRRSSCGICDHKFNPDNLITWTDQNDDSIL
jgi:predicted SprT family Zn-dependent metalloprotease